MRLAADDGPLPLLVRLGRIRHEGHANGEVESGRGDLGRDDLVRDALGRDALGRIEPADDPEPPDDGPSFDELMGAALAWAAPYRDAAAFITAVRERQGTLAELRRADARLTLATAHSTKGLEFDEVAVVDMDAGRFPSQRTLDDADDPARALEEERRLAYVAWTRARRSLTLVYDPAAPSPFLLESFDEGEL